MTDRYVRVAPALAALVYPALVWSGPAIWPPLVFLALLCPAVALWAALRLGARAAPGARAIALVAAAAPALFSLLGGLLDFQRAVPLSSVGVWIPLWLGLGVLASRAPTSAPRPVPPSSPPSRLAKLHGALAIPIIAFALAHVANHAAAIVSGDAHVAIMGALRGVYRHPVVEPLLLACVVGQLGLGLVLAGRRVRRPAQPIETLQSVAGAYLAGFLCSHVTAVLRARHRGVETGWRWLVESDVYHDPWSARLAPYYVLAVLALAVHLACAVRAVAIGHGATARGWARFVAAAVGLAAATSAVIMTALA